MSNDLVVHGGGDLAVMSDRFAGLVAETSDDLSGGVSGSYAIISIKGSRFSLKFKGDMTPITNPENGDPVGSMELVLVKSNPFLTKQFYEKGYVEGDTAAPDCFSIDGKTPSASSPSIQHTNCATCPQNAFTKINEKTGKKTKACQDNRKMAILPLSDLKNEVFGGPMLMRIPAASLGDLATFGGALKSRGYAYNSVAVRVSFDLTVAYPKLIFKAIRALTDDEADQVIEWYKSDIVDKMLADFTDLSTAEAKANPPPKDELFEEPPPAKAAPAPAPAPVKAAVVKPAPAQAPKAPPAQAPAPKPNGVSFGGTKVAAPPAKTAPAAPPAAAKPKAAPKPAPVQVAQPEEAAAPATGEDVDTTTEVISGNLENDIAGILDELNTIAG
jgi:hypothetical protein